MVDNDVACLRVVDSLERTNPSLCNQIRLASRWLRLKRPTFVLTPQMQTLFEYTALNEITTDDITLPFRCIWISFPESGRKIWNEITGLHDLRGAYVAVTGEYRDGDAEDYDVRSSGMIAFGLWAAPRPDARSAVDDALFNFSLTFDEIRKHPDLEEYLKESLYHRQWQADIGAKEYLAGVDAATINRASSWEGTPHETNVETCRWVFRQVMNTLLYLQTSDPDVETVDANTEYERQKTLVARRRSSKKIKKHRQKLAKMPRGIIHLIGFNMTNGNTTSRIKGNNTGGSVRPHWRRGHWHRYWTGPRTVVNGERQPGTKLIRKWAAPVWISGDGSKAAQDTDTSVYVL
jgi:hypothetical protein